MARRAACSSIRWSRRRRRTRRPTPKRCYWRATLAATSADAERDYRRVVVEYPLSPRAGDALLQLAQLEIARGDRTPAITHLQRFLLENPKSTERSRAGLLLVRLAFEQSDLQVGCTFLGRILREVPESSVELRNQLAYYSPRCSNVDTTKFTQVAAAPGAPTAGDTTAKRWRRIAASRFGGRVEQQDAIHLAGGGVQDTRRGGCAREALEGARHRRADRRHCSSVPCAHWALRHASCGGRGGKGAQGEEYRRVRHGNRQRR